MDEDEKQKVKRLMKEKGKVDDQKLEWMYKEDKPDDEDYLLGKRIDKAMEKQENSKEDDVGALFNERIQANIAMDMQTKMREDPLFAIRKKEEEAKRRLLQNPVKMKRLQQMIDQKKKESKEHKVKKKHKSRDSDSDDDIMAKYLNIINRKQKSVTVNYGGQKSQSEHQRESQRERSPSLIEKEDKQQSRTGVRSKQRESDSHDEEYQRKEKNYRDREKKEGRNEDWRSREGRRDLESDRERHRQHRDMDTGRMQRYSNFNFDHRENLHGNRKVDSSRKRRDSDSDNDSLSRNYDTSKQRKEEWSESERAGYHRNKEKDQIRKQNYSDSEDNNYSSNRKDIRLDKHRHSDIDEERKEKKFDKRNFGLEYRSSSKETGKKQRHSDSEDDHQGKKKRHSDSEDDHHGKKQRHSDSEDDHHGKKQRHSDSEDDHQGKKQRYSKDDHHSNKRIKTERPRSSPESEDDRKSNDGKLKNKTYGYGLVMPRGVSPVRKFEKTSSSDRSGSSKMSGSRSPKGRKSRSPSPKRMKPSQKQSKTRSPVNKRSSSGRCVLSEEERKRRLEEMMDNAKWREDQRKQNVTRYREEDKREEENQNKNFDSSHFLKPMISGHVEKSSVEDRLKRNKYNILRTTADLDRGFSKK